MKPEERKIYMSNYRKAHPDKRKRKRVRAKRNKKEFCIYKIYWLNNCYFYFGQTSNFEERKKGHILEMKRGEHSNCNVQAVYNKYGLPKIRMVEVSTPEEINDLEQDFIDRHILDEHCCNRNSFGGGYNNSLPRRHTPMVIVSEEVAKKFGRYQIRNGCYFVHSFFLKFGWQMKPRLTIK